MTLMPSAGRITAARLTPLPHAFRDPLPQVWVSVDGGAEQMMFDFYPDEISFTPEEFIGLTLAQARELKQRKDRAYLAAP